MAKALLMRYAKLMNSVINRIIDVYEANAGTKLPKRALLLHNMSWLSEVILIGGYLFYMFVGILHLINPIYAYFWQHEFKPLMPLYIPFIDVKSSVGFVILISIQTLEVFAAVMATGCADFPFMILVLNVRIFTTIFEDSANELNVMLHERKVDMLKVKAQLKHISKMYGDIWM